MRDARGGEDFRRRAAAILGAEPEVISGDEEAALTFAGALSGLGIEGAVLVFDLGGGSTEIIRGEVGPAGAVPARARSLDVGCVRLTERHLHRDPPSEGELVAVRADARAALETLPPGLLVGAPRVVGVAGTVTTLAACALGVTPYDAARVHGARLEAAEIERLTADLARLPLAARRVVPALEPRRADVIVAGGAVVGEILGWAGADALIVSDRGVRWGLAQRLASS
jgi:exopolyphosphatase/guanosine-5'-triphosphate,3'-diphosphate pyrophosphatase